MSSLEDTHFGKSEVKRESRFRPRSKPLAHSESGLVKILCISILLCMLLLPSTMNGNYVLDSVSPQEISNLAQEENLIHFSLPEDNMKITVGSLLSFNGFAYASDVADKVYFVDLLQDVSLERDIPAGDAQISYLLTADYDNDGHDEFILPNDVGGVDYAVIVDFNDGETLVVQLPGDITSPVFRGFGDFNGDTYSDLLICHNGYRKFYTIDLYNNVTIGSFNTNWGYFATIGRFESSTHDSIAVIDRYYYSPPSYFSHRNITIVDGDGTWLRDTMLSFTVSGISTFDYLVGVDDLAIIDSTGYVSVYIGNTLGQLYRQPVVSTSISSIYIDTGQFDIDGQEDIVLVDRNSEKAFFVSGATGLVISEIEEVVVGSTRRLDVGHLDQDTNTDLVISHTSGGLALVRGVDSVMAHIEYLIDLGTLGVSSQILTFDANSNGRDDTFCRVGSDVYLQISDVTPPETFVMPISPIHPTVLDDYVTVEVQVHESTTMDTADIFVRKMGTTTWTQPQDEMFSSHESNIYYAFIGDLEQGTYEYFMEFKDAFLNIGSAGNDTHPLTFDVTGDYVWYEDKSESTFMRHGGHYGDVGNASDGSKVIYTVENIVATTNLLVTKYSAGGVVLDSLVISLAKLSEYALYTAMLDGDNIADIIVFDYHYSSGPVPGYHVYHGSNFTLMGTGIAPAFKSFNYLGVFNDDNDNREEFYILADSQDTILKMESDLTWTFQALEDPLVLGYRGFTVIDSGSISGAHIAILRDDTRIDLHSADDLSFSHSLDVELTAFSSQEAIGIWPYHNSTTGKDQMIAAYNYWDGPTPTARFYLFDDMTTNVNNTPVYTIPGRDAVDLFPVDASGDSTDELFILLSAGESRLVEITSSITTVWNTTITGATPLSIITSDFDGDLANELLIFTNQDDRLTVLSLTGEIERSTLVGEVHYPFEVGNVDLGPGMEIGAFPITTPTTTTVGVIRDLDRYYDLSVIPELASPDVVQGSIFDTNVTVVNVYGETITDASVYLATHYMTPGGPAIDTFALYYGWLTGKYWGDTDAGWPMGLTNLSVIVDHDFYHTYEKTYVDAVTVWSNLHVTVNAPPFVNQGENMSIEAWVYDNRDILVEDATVTITFGGVGQTATQTGPLYLLYIPEVQLGAGFHIASAEADHPYALSPGVGEQGINVRILASSLIVNTDFPVIIKQNELVSAWFNITDQYGSPVTGAIVSLVSGPVGFELIESSIPGSYNFTHFANMGIGNQSYELRIERLHIFGNLISEVNFDVFGPLAPNVGYDTRVAGGSDFVVSIFVKDQYGPIFIGTSVTIDINGTLYYAAHTISGIPEYNLWVTADFLLGDNSFTIYVDAAFANETYVGVYNIRTFSDAATDAELFSSEGWVLTQGDQTLFELHFVDWADRPVGGATVTVFVKALSYNLLESSPGVYAAMVSTAGWLPGEYEYVVSVVHPDVETGEPINGSLAVLGQIEFGVIYSPETPIQGQELLVIITAVDGYGNPVPDLDVFIEFMGLSPMPAYPTDVIGEYVVSIPHIPSTAGYGDFTLAVTATGDFVTESVDTSNIIPIAPATPSFAMSTSSLSLGAGASFVLSLIGMVIYFRMASSMRVEEESPESRKKSIKNMDRLYLLIVLVSGAGLVGSYSMYTAGNYAIALVLTVALLGCSVLLYGLWLYRDATAAMLVRGSLSRRRMVLGLWHLVFVPLVIFMILVYGVEIDWFKAYIIDQSFTIGTISVPTIMTTIFTAYMSSILVVVVNLYREVSKGLKKIVTMEDAGTPASVVQDEKKIMVGRFSSSIRIKFLMFLVVVGATTVMSMDFLASWELGIIVLLPVAFLVVIPFISSKIIQVFSKMTRGKIPTTPVDA